MGNSIISKVHDALGYSEARAHKVMRDLLFAILPDNDNFTTENATEWERALGLFNGSSLSLSERKANILRKMQHPGDIPARQDANYLKGQLQAVGFDVYVHEYIFNPTNPDAAIYGEFDYAERLYGAPGIVGEEILANYIDATKDATYETGGVDNNIFGIYVGAEVFPNFASVPSGRKREFRELILRIKPAHTVAWLLINYT